MLTLAAGNCVPMGGESCRGWHKHCWGGVAVGALLASPAFAGDRAVSAPVLTVDGSGGSVGGSPTGLFSASGTAPVGDRFGIQLDGELGQSGDRGQGGTGAHVFWRDPAVALVGATAMWSRIGGWNVFRYGVEAEAYLGDFTLAPSAGLQHGDANKGSSSSGYAALDLSWYARDDLKLNIGGSGYSNVRGGFAGVEWQPMADTPFTLFADGGGGNRAPGFALAGIRFTFGAPGSSLKERNRHGDPENLVSFTNAGGGSGGGSLATAAQAISTTTTAATSSGGGANGPGGGGGGGCFVADTAVLMADGTIRAIETVAVGDVVRGADGEANRVEKLHRPLLGGNALYALNGGAGFVTDDHPFMTRGGWKAINPLVAEKTNPGLVVDALVAGDTLVTDTAELPVRTLEARSAPADTQLYNFTVAGNRTFLVRPAGMDTFLLVHNK